MTKKTITNKTTLKTIDVKRVFSSDTKQVLQQLLNNAIGLIESDEINDGWKLGFLATHLELIAELADDHDHFKDAQIGECNDPDFCDQLQRGTDWLSIVRQATDYGHISPDLDGRLLHKSA